MGNLASPVFGTPEHFTLVDMASPSKLRLGKLAPPDTRSGELCIRDGTCVRAMAELSDSDVSRLGQFWTFQGCQKKYERFK